ncbi:carbohydrate ABC transporter membrane protein 1 (CUT1 family) [Thermosporothrix hazakensis]|jgi:ABC-type sugar transport system permease subunit|uniref:Carbohydrate ABC transporter membrane protein 1 (CUT1 family) n=1 Tax=Thermosporothrix hazakensis TaxID=644383 RepID=A0A326U406_THEHA|nr:sugar ABC transporter permease [Thermosporothrix hazakensis]PZW25621.1 carbohydrate ABC transporter membrane protein 1 (CUT1 family) [Thermosporothrix hazakensis]GCE48116.1 hypothetical protein KTH_29850 [Thermosporothrix hazakensis]
MAVKEAKVEKSASPGLMDRIRMNGGFLPYILILPTLLLILVIAVYPMLDSIRLSMLHNPFAARPKFVGLQNYITVFQDPVFRQAMGTTMIYTVLSVALESIFGLLIALLINKSFPGRGLVRAAILVPWAFPTIVSAQMWFLMYGDQTGILTYILRSLHLLAEGDTLLNSVSGVITASVITDVWKTTPFMALLLLAGLQVIPADLYEAASVDGATRWQQFTRITLPMLKNPFLIALLFRLLDAIRVFDLFYVFGKQMVPSLASFANIRMFGSNTEFSQGVATSILIFIIGIIISIIFGSMLRSMLKEQG